MTEKLKRGSPEAELALAVRDIFKTKPGKLLRQHLTDRAMTMSAVDASSGLLDERSTCINEGRRLEALTILAAENAEIEGD